MCRRAHPIAGQMQDFVKNVSSIERKSLSDESAIKIKAEIRDDKTFPPEHYNPGRVGTCRQRSCRSTLLHNTVPHVPSASSGPLFCTADILTDSGTSQLSVVTADGSAVTLTTTINLFWGSQLMTPDGIILNDEMDDFSRPGASNAFGYVAASANFIKPGKRPLSSISPVIAEKDGVVSFALGSAGGSRIITANIINSFNALSGVDLQKSLVRPDTK